MSDHEIKLTLINSHTDSACHTHPIELLTSDEKLAEVSPAD